MNFGVLEKVGLLAVSEGRHWKTEEYYSVLLKEIIDKQIWSGQVFRSSYRERVTMWDLVNVLLN